MKKTATKALLKLLDSLSISPLAITEAHESPVAIWKSEKSDWEKLPKYTASGMCAYIIIIIIIAEYARKHKCMQASMYSICVRGAAIGK
jgi:hypothetical protein